MAAPRIKYKRLPGRRRGIFRGSSLWLGDDHVLAVTGWRFVEDYKRYYYRDIQALVLARTRRWVATVPWILAALALVVGASTAHLGSIAWLSQTCVDALVVLVFLWLLLSLGASTRCRVQTAVSCEDLPSLFRLWSARKAIRILAARIAEAQGTLAEGWAAQIVEAPPLVPAAGSDTRKVEAAPQRRGGIRALAMVFYASLVLTVALFFAPGGWFWLAFMVVHMGLAIATVIGQGRRGGPGSPRKAAITVLILIGVAAIAFYGALVAAFIRAGALGTNTPPVPEMPGVNRFLVYAYAACCAATGVAGALSATLSRRGKE
jgi:hypothetical protein